MSDMGFIYVALGILVGLGIGQIIGLLKILSILEEE